MSKELSSEIRLRPIRIGFLVKPTDKSSIRKIMRVNTVLWGGIYNPIIPVCSRTPNVWKDENRRIQISGAEITSGYIKFFEPDLYVEAEEGLLEKAGLGDLRSNTGFRDCVVSLDHFLSAKYAGRYDPVFGQNIFDVLKGIYDTERRFILRDQHPAVISSQPNDTFAELCIGVYPEGRKHRYLHRAYKDVYEPEVVKSTHETWLKVYKEGFVTPLRATRKHLEDDTVLRDLTIYVFNPAKPWDLIDVWNSRIEPRPILPVPIQWFSDVAEYLKEEIANNHFQINQNGVMNHTSIIRSTSISEEQYQTVIQPALDGIPEGSLWGSWRTPYPNISFTNPHGPRYERLKLTCENKRMTLPVQEGDWLRIQFPNMSPSFADQYAGSKSRWANVLSLGSDSYGNYEIATIFPHNTFNREWPRIGMGGERVNICREGWVYFQDFKGSEQPVSLMKSEDAICDWFSRNNIKATMSDPGRIAKQMLLSLEGFWGLYLLRRPETIQAINKIAKKRNPTAGEDSWQQILNIHLKGNTLPDLKIEDYVKRSIIRLGIETKCPNCGNHNWHSLKVADYELDCERCLRKYNFPQAQLDRNNKNWKYRVVGPFAVPNYAEGAYGTLLTVNALKDLPRDMGKSVNFSTALNLEFEGKKCEIDFAIWSANEARHDSYGDPQLIIGEAKSFADEAIKEKDIEQLKLAASWLPNSVLVVSVLKEDFSEEEKQLLRGLVDWTRDPNKYEPKNWLILLTGTELFAEFHIESAWQEKGEPHSNYAQHFHSNTFESLSDATLSIYLGLPSFYKWQNSVRNNRND